jgi:hypothetical protein
MNCAQASVNIIQEIFARERTRKNVKNFKIFVFFALSACFAGKKLKFFITSNLRYLLFFYAFAPSRHQR